MLLETPYEYNATLVRVVDGDTIVLKIDLGFKIVVEQTVRLRGINAPESIGVDWQAGHAAKEAVERILLQESFGRVCVRTFKPEKKDRSGAYLADITYISSSGEFLSLNDRLVELGHAKRIT